MHNRRQRVASCQELLHLYTSDKEKYCCRLVTGDETWIHHGDPESTLEYKESIQRKHVDCPPPKKFRTQPAVGKSYHNNFGDSEELLMVDYLPSKKTIIGQYYAEIMFKSYDAVNQKCRWKQSLSVWLIHDNTPSLQVICCTTSFSQLWISLTKPPCVYSPDLAPNDCYLFTNLRYHLRGPGLQTMNHQKLLLKHGLKGRMNNSFFEGINSLPEKWQKCIDITGDYTKK